MFSKSESENSANRKYMLLALLGILIFFFWVLAATDEDPDEFIKKVYPLARDALYSVDGQRALVSQFTSDNQRVAVISLANGDSLEVTRPNRIISLKQEKYSDLYLAALRDTCWVYRTDHQSRSSLDVGLREVGAESLISIPIRLPDRKLWGALSISFDSKAVDPNLICGDLFKYGRWVGEAIGSLPEEHQNPSEFVLNP